MIKFGTDGWRDIIGEDFTYENVRKVAHAHALYLLASGAKRALVGFDTRFQGEGFARVAAETMAAAGLEVLLSSAYLPTPALSFAVKHYGLRTTRRSTTATKSRAHTAAAPRRKSLVESKKCSRQ